MPDFSQMSDEDLVNYVNSKVGSSPSPAAAKPSIDPSKMSDEELVNFVNNKITNHVAGPSSGQDTNYIGEIGHFLDAYGGASSARAGLDALLRTQEEFGKPHPSILGNIKDAGSAAYNAYGSGADLAPTGEEIARKRLGLSDKPILSGTPSFAAAKGGIAPEANAPDIISQGKQISPASVVGGAIDVVADPINLIPIGEAAKGAAKLGLTAAKETGKFALDTAVGGIKALMPGATAKKAVQAGVDYINAFVNPKVAEDFGKLAEIADKHGIDISNAPAATEFGENSFIDKGSRVQAQGPGGQARLQHYNDYMNNVSSAFDKKVADIGGGEVLGQADAGQALRDGYDKALDTLFKQNDINYKNVANSAPWLPLDEAARTNLDAKLSEIYNYADGLIKRGHSATLKSQGQGLINAIKAIRSTDGTLGQTIEELQAIGDTAFPRNRNIYEQLPPDTKKFRDIYNALKDATFTTIETGLPEGDKIAASLRTSNQNISKFFEQSKQITDVLGNPKVAPEDAFKRLTKNTNQIEALQNILAPEDFAKVKSAYMDNLASRMNQGYINFQDLKTKLENKNIQDVISHMFEPDEIKDLTDIATLGKRAGLPILNTSGTDISTAFRSPVNGLKQAVLNESTIEGLKERARAASGISLPNQPEIPRAPYRGGLTLPQQGLTQVPRQVYLHNQNEKRK